MAIDEAKEIIRKTKSPYLKRDMETLIKRIQKKMAEQKEKKFCRKEIKQCQTHKI